MTQAGMNCTISNYSICHPLRYVHFVLLVFALAAAGQATGRGADLEQGFRKPPESARPWVYWFVMDGNLTREGITADFEALKKTGVGGVFMMEVDVGIPRGPVKFMSAEWRALFKHAVIEADNEVGFHDRHELALGLVPMRHSPGRAHPQHQRLLRQRDGSRPREAEGAEVGNRGDGPALGLGRGFEAGIGACSQALVKVIYRPQFWFDLEAGVSYLAEEASPEIASQWHQ